MKRYSPLESAGALFWIVVSDMKCLCMYVCMYVCVRACVRACVCACVRACLVVALDSHIYIYDAHVNELVQIRE